MLQCDYKSLFICPNPVDIFVSLSSAEYVVNEGDGFVVVVIEKSGITPNNEETEVLLTLQDGTARGVCY